LSIERALKIEGFGTQIQNQKTHTEVCATGAYSVAYTLVCVVLVWMLACLHEMCLQLVYWRGVLRHSKLTQWQILDLNQKRTGCPSISQDKKPVLLEAAFACLPIHLLDVDYETAPLRLRMRRGRGY
jgi:hypothetical protein